MSKPRVSEGFVLMLDMLGFKERAESDMFEMYDIWKELKAKIEYQTKFIAQGYDARIQTLFISDTIISCFSLKKMITVMWSRCCLPS